MARNSYQEGHVSGPRKSRKGVYFEIRYRVPLGNGEWRQCGERIYGLSGRKAAKEVLRDRLNSVSKRPAPGVERITFKEYVEGYFLPALERSALKPSTLYGYRSSLRTHLQPAFGATQMREVEPLQVEEFVQATLKAGTSPKTVRNVLLLLDAIFTDAAELKVVVGSPVRKKHKPKVPKRKRTTWSPDQLKAIILAVPLIYRALTIAVVLTGIRLGELLALQWRNFAPDKCELYIVQSLWRGKVNDPKSEDSFRTIQLGSVLTQVLLAHQQGSCHSAPDDLVFGKADGSHLDPDVMRKDVLYPALDRLGIVRVKRLSGFHGFRHAAGSVVNQETGNMKLAQMLLGHADYSTTANIYTHTATTSERQTSEVLERAILGDLFADVFAPRTTTVAQESIN